MQHAVPSLVARPWAPLAAALLALAALAGCGNADAPASFPDGADEGNAARDTTPGPDAAYERALVFLSADPDSILAVPWTFRTQVVGELERRERGVWAGRGGEWRELAEDAEESDRSAAPWRILPGSAIRFVVGEGDALQALFLRRGTAELRPGIPLAEWSETGPEAVRFHRATIALGSEEEEGYLLDLSTAREGPATPPGDWIFLHGEERFQAAFAERGGGAAGRSPARFRGWTRFAVREGRWSELIVEWDEVRAFEEARRDVPVRWSFASPEQEITGEIESVGHHLSAGAGEGPLLPVDGFFQVEGEVRMEGETFPVWGVVHHRQR